MLIPQGNKKDERKEESIVLHYFLSQVVHLPLCPNMGRADHKKVVNNCKMAVKFILQ